jgi:ankyrin repeat protein
MGLAFTLACLPAMAQLSAGSGGGDGLTPKAPTPQPRTPDIAPQALPGAPVPAVATGPVLAKPDIGDPTAALFAAITKGDDSAAQYALGRGADLDAQDQFGETPLDLSIALNRTSITFLLLQTRNELAAQGNGPEPLGAPWTLDQNAGPLGKDTAAYKPPPAPAQKPQAAGPVNNGTPNPDAGFLGFGPKN